MKESKSFFYSFCLSASFEIPTTKRAAHRSPCAANAVACSLALLCARSLFTKRYQRSLTKLFKRVSVLCFLGMTKRDIAWNTSIGW